MWTTIGIVVLGLVALLLATPLELTVRCERRTRFRCRLGCKWLFGLVSTEMAPEHPGEVEGPAPARPSKKRRRRKGRGPAHVVAMLRTRGFLLGAMRLARLLHAFRVRDLFVRLRAGFDDHADTGFLCSWMMPAAAWLEARHPGHWDLAPVFSGPTFRIAASGRLRVIPARLVWPALAFGLSPSTIRGFIALRRGRPG